MSAIPLVLGLTASDLTLLGSMILELITPQVSAPPTARSSIRLLGLSERTLLNTSRPCTFERVASM